MLAPYHETLYAYCQLGEHSHIDALIRNAEGFRAAKRNSMAFNKPKDLADERNNLLDELGALPDPAEAMARGRKMIDDLNRIDAARLEAESSNGN